MNILTWIPSFIEADDELLTFKILNEFARNIMDDDLWNEEKQKKLKKKINKQNPRQFPNAFDHGIVAYKSNGCNVRTVCAIEKCHH